MKIGVVLPVEPHIVHGCVAQIVQPVQFFQLSLGDGFIAITQESALQQEPEPQDILRIPAGEADHLVTIPGQVPQHPVVAQGDQGFPYRGLAEAILFYQLRFIDDLVRFIFSLDDPVQGLLIYNVFKTAISFCHMNSPYH